MPQSRQQCILKLGPSSTVHSRFSPIDTTTVSSFGLWGVHEPNAKATHKHSSVRTSAFCCALWLLLMLLECCTHERNNHFYAAVISELHRSHTLNALQGDARHHAVSTVASMSISWLDPATVNLLAGGVPCYCPLPIQTVVERPCRYVRWPG